MKNALIIIALATILTACDSADSATVGNITTWRDRQRVASLERLSGKPGTPVQTCSPLSVRKISTGYEVERGNGDTEDVELRPGKFIYNYDGRLITRLTEREANLLSQDIEEADFIVMQGQQEAKKAACIQGLIHLGQ